MYTFDKPSVLLDGEPGPRDFLPRPPDHEGHKDVWHCWQPLFDWLVEYQPDHFYGVCEAEDALRRLEEAGIYTGPMYRAACDELLTRFERARDVATDVPLEHPDMRPALNQNELWPTI